MQAMEPTDATRKPLVLRIEIAPEHYASLGALLGAPQPAAPAAPVPAAAPAPAAVPSVADAELRRRTADLEELQARLAAERVRLQESARELAEREAEVAAAKADELTASDRIRLAHRAQRAQEVEQELGAREELLDERETELYRREAAFEADVELREEQIEQWRGELGDLESRLKRKERELLAYVAQL